MDAKDGGTHASGMRPARAREILAETDSYCIVLEYSIVLVPVLRVVPGAPTLTRTKFSRHAYCQWPARSGSGQCAVG